VNVGSTGEADKNVQIEREEANVRFERTGEPEVNVSRAEPNINVEQTGEPNIRVEQDEARVQYEQIEGEDEAQQGRGAQQRSAQQDQEQQQGQRSQQQSAQDDQDRRTRQQQARNQQQAGQEQANRQQATGQSTGTQDEETDRQQTAALTERTQTGQQPDQQAQGSAAQGGQAHPLSNWKVENLVGQPVYSERNDEVGEIDNLAMRGDQLFAIIGVGGFLGLGVHHVAIPFDRISYANDRIILPALTQEELENTPAYNEENYQILQQQERTVRQASESH
jgi:sporulation protein YlmC with PRC-barrel domain